MKYCTDNNEGNSSIFQGKILDKDFSAEQKCNELKGFMEELARKAELKRIELEHQASNCTDEVSSQIELQISENDDHFAVDTQGAFADFFELLFNLCEVEIDPEVYKMLKEKKEKSLLLSIIKFLRDKLKELTRKVFKKDLDLSWDKRLDKEIKELQEKLFSGGLSPEEEMAILQRLEALQNLKLKLQTFLVGLVVTMFAEIFAVNLAAVVEQSTRAEKEEDRKVEKGPSKEKEVCKEVEIKVDEKEVIAPISLLDFSFKFPRPITLNKQERSLFPKPIEKLVDSFPKLVIPSKGSEVEKMNDKEKKPKLEEPKLAVCPPAPEKKEKKIVAKKYRGIGGNVGRRSFGLSRSAPCRNDHTKPDIEKGSAELPGKLTANVEVENPASVSRERL